MNDNRSNNKFNIKDTILKLWNKGKLQKTSRITYDVVWNIILFFIVLGVIGFAFAGGVGAGYFASLVKDEPIRSYDEMKKNIYDYEETTQLYFDGNKYLGKLRSDLYREEVKLDDVSPYVKDAIIATEDEYFNQHNGVVPKAIMRALFQEVTNSSVKSGGSTLTQQLIKNQILTNEVSFERKAKEILLALRLEKFFNKDEILEAYLNVVPFGRNSSGRNIAGVQAAAQGIFNVDAKDLNLPQAAFIAGLPQSPYYYTPFNNDKTLKSKEGLEPGLDRMKTVLQRLYETGEITEAEYNQAKNYDIVADFAKPEPSPIQQYPYLTIEIEKRAKKILAQKLAEDDGYTLKDLENNETLNEQYMILADRNLRRNGYKIHTTIDKDIYDKMQELKNNYDQYGPDKAQKVDDPKTGETKTIMEPVQVGGMLIENKTGKIIGFIGGRDWNKEQLNHATDAPRPNGSTMKPILDYAPAIEQGVVQPGTPIADTYYENSSILTKDGKPWSPENYTGRFHGLVTARYALAKSYNVPAIKTYEKIIDTNPMRNYLYKLGFTTLKPAQETYLSAAIGTPEVTIEENTNAYVAFANGGQFVDAYLIDSIETNNGDIIYKHESKPVDVYTPQAAYLTVDMMRDVVKYGTAASTQYWLENKNVDWAGKTGTSQFFRDTWFVATNPNVTFGMWMGYDTPKSLQCSTCQLGYSSQNVKLWSEIVNEATKLRPELMAPTEKFKQPGGIVRSNYCEASGMLPSEACQELGLVKSDIFAAKYVPTETDTSLIKGTYAMVGGQVLLADPMTPPEFTNAGYLFNPTYLEEKGFYNLVNENHKPDLQQLIPAGEAWSKVLIPAKPIENDLKQPGKPATVKIVDGVLSWEAPVDTDVVGYRIYRADSPNGVFNLVGNTTELEFKLSKKNGVYYVKAVDFFGLASDPSATAVHGKIIEKEDPTIPDPLDDGNGNGDSNTDNSNDGSNDGQTNGSNDSGNSNDGTNSSGDSSGSGTTSGGTNDGSGDNNTDSGTTNGGTSSDDSSESDGIPNPLGGLN